MSLEHSGFNKEQMKVINSDPQLQNIMKSLDPKSIELIKRLVGETSGEIAKLAKMMKELEGASGGASGKLSTLATSIKAVLAPFVELGREYNKYAVNLEKIGASSQIGVNGLQSMRRELSLFKKEMGDFYQTSNRLAQSGFNKQDIVSTFKDFRKAFGNEASEMMKELATIYEKVPTMKKSFREARGQKANAPASSEDIYNMMEAGVYDTHLQISARGGKFSGDKGSPIGNEYADKQNKEKDFQAKIERAQDYVGKTVPAEVLIMSDILTEVQKITGIIESVGRAGKAGAGILTGAGSYLGLGKAGGGSAMAGARMAGGRILGGMAKIGPWGIGAAVTGASMAAWNPEDDGSTWFGSGKTAQKIGRSAKKELKAISNFTPFGAASNAIDLFTRTAHEARIKATDPNWKETLRNQNYRGASSEAFGKWGASGGFSGMKELLKTSNYGGAHGISWKTLVGMDGPTSSTGNEKGTDNSDEMKEAINRAKPGLVTKKLSEIRDSTIDVVKNINAGDPAKMKKIQKEMSQMTFAGLSGTSSDVEKSFLSARELSDEFYDTREKEGKKQLTSTQDDIKKFEGIKATLTAKGKDTTETDKVINALKNKEMMIETSLADLGMAKVNAFGEQLTKAIEEAGRSGKKGYGTLLGQRMASVSSESRVSESLTKGGYLSSYKSAKESNIATKTTELENAKAAVSVARTGVSSATNEKDRTLANEKLTAAMEKEKSAIQELNSALLDSRGLEYVRNQLSAMMEVTSALGGYLEATNGSWSAMSPILKEQVSIKEKEAEATRKWITEQRGRGVSEESPEMINARKTLAKQEIDVAKSKFEMAKKERDLKVEEHQVASSIMKEQSDFLAEMGGSFGDVISMKSQALEQDRAAIKDMQDYIARADESGLSGLEKEKAIADLKRKEMELVRNQVGIQRTTYEKFAGMAFGALSDKGYKKGRMDTSVMGGTDATRVRNLAGMATGENTFGLNRDQMSGVLGIPAQLGASRGKNKETLSPNQKVNAPVTHKFELTDEAKKLFRMVRDTNSKVSGGSGASR